MTSQGAVDTDLGILKTGKEADVYLLERADPHEPERAVVMAAKRYRGEEHRSFHRSTAYREGRRMRNTRDARALARKSAHGRAVAAGQWAWAEWEALVRFHGLGVPVPYPVQVDGTEILMEWVTVEGRPRPGWPRPVPTRTCSRPTTTSCATRSR
ncbi:MAG: serine/threonine protein kinase [Nocardioides sp.]|nr:serine/threonine protein kinase [Nocardioides sp.]